VTLTDCCTRESLKQGDKATRGAQQLYEEAQVGVKMKSFARTQQRVRTFVQLA